MRRIRYDNRWAFAENALREYLTVTPIVIGLGIKEKFHAKNLVVSYRPDYQRRNPKIVPLANITLHEWAIDIHNETRLSVGQNYLSSGHNYQLESWIAIFALNKKKKYKTAGKVATSLFLLTMDAAGTVCSPFPPGFMGDNPAEATRLLGKLAEGALWLDSTPQERERMKQGERMLKHINLPHDPDVSFVGIKCTGVHRQSGPNPTRTRFFDWGQVEIGQVHEPIGTKVMTKLSMQFPYRNYEWNFKTNTMTQSGASPFTLTRLHHHNQNWV